MDQDTDQSNGERTQETYAQLTSSAYMALKEDRERGNTPYQPLLPSGTNDPHHTKDDDDEPLNYISL